MDIICTAFSFQNPYAFPLTQLSQNTACCSTLLSVEHLSSVFWRKKLCDIYSSIGCALSSFRSPLGPPFDFLFDTCSCQTARCFNKSKGVLITGSKLKAFLNPLLGWGGVCASSRRRDHSRRPLTPPYVRFRIRRFMLTLELPLLFQQ